MTNRCVATQPHEPVSRPDFFFQAYHVAGNVTKVVATDSLGLSPSSIACVPCDLSDYPGPLKVDDTLANLLTAQPPPAAILLYSSSASICKITSSDESTGQFDNLFTVTSLHASTDLQSLFDSNKSAVTIVPMSSAGGFTGSDVNPASNGGGGGNSPNTGS